MKLPQARDFQEFESMTRAAMALRWNSPNIQKNGRPGQRQHGVDIHGADDIGRLVAIQCKNYSAPPSLAVVKKEIANAEKFKGGLSALFIATSAEFDAPLQQAVRLLSEQRVAAGHFAVAMIFWEEIVDGLQLNPQVLRNFYPQLVLPTGGAPDRGRLLAATELGFYGPFVWDYIQLIYGEFGWMAQEDTDQVEVILRIVDQRAAQLLDEADAVMIRHSVAKVRKHCAKRRKDDRTWTKVEGHAKRIANRVKAASSLLEVNEALALDAGRSLGNIYIHHDDAPDEVSRQQVRRQALAIVPGAEEEIDAALDKVAAAQSGYSWVPTVYTRLMREIRLRG